METIILGIALLLFCIVHAIIFVILHNRINRKIKNSFKNVPSTLMEKSSTFEKLAKDYFDKNKCKVKIEISKHQTDYSTSRNILNISNKDNSNISKLNYSYILFLINTAVMFNKKTITSFDVIMIFYIVLKAFLFIVVFSIGILFLCGLGIVLKPLYIGIFVLFIAIILVLALLVYKKSKEIYENVIIGCKKEIAENNELTKEDQKEMNLAFENAIKPSLLKVFLDYSMIEVISHDGPFF